MYLLDTNVISELRKLNTNRADANVVAWLKNTQQHLNHISVITVLELEEGFNQIKRRDPRQAGALRDWLSGIYELFENRIVEFGFDAARRTAPLSSPDPMSKRDAMIAGTALTHELHVVTRNIKDFKGVTGLTLLNPWNPGAG